VWLPGLALGVKYEVSTAVKREARVQLRRTTVRPRRILTDSQIISARNWFITIRPTLCGRININQQNLNIENSSSCLLSQKPKRCKIVRPRRLLAHSQIIDARATGIGLSVTRLYIHSVLVTTRTKPEHWEFLEFLSRKNTVKLNMLRQSHQHVFTTAQST
jgi:hypothetical protein